MLSTNTLAIVNQVHVAQQRISRTVHILLLNLPKGRTMNGESIVSASQVMVKQQGLKQQKRTNHGADHEMVKLWCIGTEVVGISMFESHQFRKIFISVQTNVGQIYVLSP